MMKYQKCIIFLIAMGFSLCAFSALLKSEKNSGVVIHVERDRANKTFDVGRSVFTSKGGGKGQGTYKDENTIVHIRQINSNKAYRGVNTSVNSDKTKNKSS